MKYKDYYKTLGIEPTASIDDIKKAYRKLAHQFHPDVSKDPQGEEKFKEAAEAYATLKNPEKRQQYDSLGKPPVGENVSPPPEWQQRYANDAAAFDDVDLGDFFKAFGANGRGARDERAYANFSQAGENYELSVPITLEKIVSGGEMDVAVEVPEFDAHGLPHRKLRTFRVNIPKGASEGQRLRLAGKGGPGHNGGKPGDLYLVLTIMTHKLYRVTGQDLYFDLPLSSWEAALGATVEVPTLGGTVALTIKPGTSSGQRLRLAKRGLPAANGDMGNLYAVVKIVMPDQVSQAEQALYEQLAAISVFKARAHFKRETK